MSNLTVEKNFCYYRKISKCLKENNFSYFLRSVKIIRMIWEILFINPMLIFIRSAEIKVQNDQHSNARQFYYCFMKTNQLLNRDDFVWFERAEIFLTLDLLMDVTLLRSYKVNSSNVHVQDVRLNIR